MDFEPWMILCSCTKFYYEDHFQQFVNYFVVLLNQFWFCCHMLSCGYQQGRHPLLQIWICLTITRQHMTAKPKVNLEKIYIQIF